MTSSVETSTAPAFRWSDIRRKDPEALRLAELEALEIARALAVESLASDQDAVLAELPERRRHLAQVAWPSKPLEGYRLQSSMGAFVVARVAIGWVPSAQTGLRHTPLTPAGVERALVQQHVEPPTARSVVGAWAGSPPDFKADEEGLDASVLAGLAERSLTPDERDAALNQVAASPRDLSRLAACLVLGRSVRRLLPVLADDGLGPEFAATLALVATDRAGRAQELLAPEADGLRDQTVRELAIALNELSAGMEVHLPPDRWAPVAARETPPLSGSELGMDEPLVAPESSNPTNGEIATIPDEALIPFDTAGAAEEVIDDILEIVEEAVDPEARPPAAWRRSDRPILPRWWPGEAPPEAMEGTWAALARHRSVARARGSALGFPGAAVDERGGPVPPDPRLRADVETSVDGQDGPVVEGSAAEPFLPAVRVMLRGVLEAVEGRQLIRREDGGLAWCYRRAEAIAAIAEGNLDGAQRALSDLWPEEAPERSWIQDRKVRYEGREPDSLTPEETRAAAASLVLDLARSLARTLTGAFADAGSD